MRKFMGFLMCVTFMLTSVVSHGSDDATTAKSENTIKQMVSPIDFQMEADVIVTKSTVTDFKLEAMEYINIGEAITINNVASVNAEGWIDPGLLVTLKVLDNNFTTDLAANRDNDISDHVGKVTGPVYKTIKVLFRLE